MPAALTLLYDGGCPLCVREVTFLRGRDRSQQLAFVDINEPDYNSHAHGGITYREAMGRIHALRDDGSVVRDVAVFREAYCLIGLGWVYAPTQWPIIAALADRAYDLWAQWRLAITRRPNHNQLCACRAETGSETLPDHPR